MKPRTRRLSRRQLLAALVAALLVVGLVVADLVVRRSVQHRIATSLSGALGEAPQVRVGGPSALWSLATDRWSSVSVEAPDAELAIEGRRVRTTLSLEADGVTGLARGDQVQARRVRGSVGSNWGQLSELVGAKLGASSEGLVTVTATVDALGEQLPVVVHGKPFITADTQRLQLLEPTATLDGVEVPPGILQGMLPKVLDQVRLPQREGLHFTTLEATPQGPRLSFEGERMAVDRP